MFRYLKLNQLVGEIHMGGYIIIVVVVNEILNFVTFELMLKLFISYNNNKPDGGMLVFNTNVENTLFNVLRSCLRLKFNIVNFNI